MRSIPLLQGAVRGDSDGLGRGVAERDGMGAHPACGGGNQGRGLSRALPSFSQVHAQAVSFIPLVNIDLTFLSDGVLVLLHMCWLG